jgi:hypothetical protein
MKLSIRFDIDILAVSLHGYYFAGKERREQPPFQPGG